MKGGVNIVTKARLLTFFVTVLPLALACAQLTLGGTGLGGFNGGGGLA
jgi:hypothetical protein